MLFRSAPADQACHWTLPPGQMREEDFTPAELREFKDGVAELVNMAYAKEVKTPADHAFREALPPGQMREEDFTPARLRELKDGIASFLTMAYAKEVKSRADMTAAELLEELERSDKLVACLRAELKVLETSIQQASSQAGGEDGKSTTEAV